MLHCAALLTRMVAEHAGAPGEAAATATPAREQLLQTAAELDALAAGEPAGQARAVHAVVGRIFFQYWDRLRDPVPDDSLEQITGELLQRLEREALPLLRRPWEKDPTRQ